MPECERRVSLAVFFALSDIANVEGTPIVTVSRLAIADHGCISVTSVSRGLAALKKTGVIRCERSTTGTEYTVELLQGYVETRRGKRETGTKAEKKADSPKSPVPVGETGKYSEAVQRWTATGMMEVKSSDVEEAVRQSSVEVDRYLVDWVAEKITERVLHPIPWLEARFREWPKVSQEYIKSWREADRMAQEKDETRRIRKAIDGVDVAPCSDYVLSVSLEGIGVPFDRPDFNQVARRVAEGEKKRTGKQLNVSSLFHVLRTQELCTKTFRMVEVENPEWK